MFSFPVILKKGKGMGNALQRQTRRYIRAAYADADALLRAGEKALTIGADALVKVDVAHLPANKPTEDCYSSAKCLASDTYLFGVFDGHAGVSCSQHVAMQLYDYICAAVLPKHIINDIPVNERTQWLFSSWDNFDGYRREGHLENISRFYHDIKKKVDVMTVRKALENAFVQLDDDFLKEAIPGQPGWEKERLNTVTSGSCAIFAQLRREHMHIANIGDSAAVMGVSTHGTVSARLLSRPHTVDNGDEIKRLRASHPQAESDNVFRNGRLFGELFPLRAFGDVRYKWPSNLQEKHLKPYGERPLQGNLTPPYLDVHPEVLYHRLTPNDRFLVLASDGLWEFLEPDTVVRLIFDHQLGAQTLTPFTPRPKALLAQVRDELKQRLIGESKKPLDENSATHVLRHALGGCSGGLETRYKRLADMLHLPYGVARSYRDDITIIVIHFNQDYIEKRHMEQQ